MKARRFSVSMKTRYLLDHIKSRPDEPTHLMDGEGNMLTPTEALTMLTIDLAMGRYTLPMSSECRNPCQHAHQGCTGFNYGEGGGCPGHEVDR